MTITEQQRNHIIALIVNDMNDYQTSDRYYFERECFTILWVSEDETYIVLWDDKTYDYYSPSDLESAISELQDDTLIEWLMTDQGFDTEEEINQYFEDLPVAV